MGSYLVMSLVGLGAYVLSDDCFCLVYSITIGIGFGTLELSGSSLAWSSWVPVGIGLVWSFVSGEHCIYPFDYFCQNENGKESRRK